jgi:hypothetical protein
MSKLETIKGDWSEHEHSRLDRIRAECAGYDGLEVECSHTDERDPWCIVYDRERDQVIVHIARIDCRYTVMRASRRQLLTVTSISIAVDAAMGELFRTGNDRRIA